MAVPNSFTEIETNGSGISDQSASRGSIEIIIDSATTNVSSVFAEYMIDGPIIMRTALRSLVARDIRVAGAVRLEIAERQRLQVREEVVPHVVLDVAGGADQDPAGQELKHAADADRSRAAARRSRPAGRG